MNPEDIDDLFRQQLGGHATPPAGDLWARLQAGDALNSAAQLPTETPAAAETATERLDQLFKTKLIGHATPPPRELWERLEDEHLRPRKRRAAAWWPMAIAAVVALLIVAGGAGLLRSGYFGRTNESGVARQTNHATKGTAGTVPNSGITSGPAEAPAIGDNSVARLGQTAGNTASITSPPVTTEGAETTKKEALMATTSKISTNSKKTFAPQATRPNPAASNGPEASSKALATTASRRASTSNRQQSAAATSPKNGPELARQTTPKPDAAKGGPAPALAPAAPSTPAPDLASSAGVIEVEVRRGGSPAAARPAQPAPAAPVVAVTTAAPTSDEANAPTAGRGRRVLGGLLRQASHAVHGERISLAEATGLPETVSLQAHVAGRTLSTSIRL